MIVAYLYFDKKIRASSMNTNMLTISDYLPQFNTRCTNSIKLDIKDNNIKFNIETDSKTKQNETLETVTTYNKDENNKLSDNQETNNDSKTENKDNSISDTEDIISAMEYKASVDSLLKEVIENIEQKRENGLAKLLEGSEGIEVLPLAAEIIGADENQELSQYRDEMHQRLKDILLGKSQDLIEVNTDLQNKFVEAIINKIGDGVVSADDLLLHSESTVITEEIQKLINEAKTEGIISDVKDIEQIVNGDNNSGTLTALKGNKEALLESTLNNTNGDNEAVGKISEFVKESVNENADGTKLQQIIGEDGLEKSVLATEMPAKEQAGVEKTYENKLDTKESEQSVNDLNKSSDINKLDIVNVQNSIKQNDELINYNSNVNIGTKIKEDFSKNSSQPLSVDQTIHYNENAKVDNIVRQNSASEVADNVGKQILESIQSSISNPVGDKQITVRLNPPELGEVIIKFQEQDNEITGLLEVNKTQTRAEIEQALPQIIRSLSDSGIDIKRLEVVLSNSERQDQDTLNEHSLFNSEQQQHNFDDSGMYEYDRDRTAIHEWLSNSISYGNNSESQGVVTADSSINILI